jgi:hypothetical protein
MKTIWYKLSEKKPPLRKKIMAISADGELSWACRESKHYYRNASYRQIKVELWARIPTQRNKRFTGLKFVYIARIFKRIGLSRIFSKGS